MDDLDRWLDWLGSILIVIGMITIGAAVQERREWRKETGMASEDDKLFAEAFRSRMFKGVMAGILALIVIALAISGIRARDLDGRYGGSPLKPWFDHLSSKRGLCCSFADGETVSDPDWDSKDGHYRVRLEGAWIDVPDDAVITVPNLFGRTMVWPVPQNEIDGKRTFGIRCFMPGSMT